MAKKYLRGFGRRVKNFVLGRVLILPKLFFEKKFISLDSQEIAKRVPKEVLGQIKELNNEDFIAQNQMMFFNEYNSPPPLLFVGRLRS